MSPLIEILSGIVVLLIIVNFIADEIRYRRRLKYLVKLESYWDGKNRRRVIRHNSKLLVNYTQDRFFNESQSMDISTHGLGILMKEKIEKGSIILIEIWVNKYSAPIRARARVMWTRMAEQNGDSDRPEYHTGLKFIKFSDPSQEKRLFDYIRSIENDSSDDYVRL